MQSIHFNTYVGQDGSVQFQLPNNLKNQEAETVSKQSEAGVPLSAIWELLTMLPYSIVDFNEQIAFLTGELRVKTLSLGLSLGDRACLATGKVLGLPIITTDKAWLKVEIGVEIRCIR